MDIPSKLLHTAKLYIRGATNTFAEYTYTFSKNINCIIWGSKTRVFKDAQPQSVDHNIDFKVIVLSSVNVNLGDQIRIAKDIKGAFIFDNAEIIRITPIIHKDKGILTRELDVVVIRG